MSREVRNFNSALLCASNSSFTRLLRSADVNGAPVFSSASMPCRGTAFSSLIQFGLRFIRVPEQVQGPPGCRARPVSVRSQRRKFPLIRLYKTTERAICEMPACGAPSSRCGCCAGGAKRSRFFSSRSPKSFQKRGARLSYLDSSSNFLRKPGELQTCGEISRGERWRS